MNTVHPRKLADSGTDSSKCAEFSGKIFGYFCELLHRVFVEILIQI